MTTHDIYASTEAAEILAKSGVKALLAYAEGLEKALAQIKADLESMKQSHIA